MQKDTLYLACTRPAMGRFGLPGWALGTVFGFWWVGYDVIGGADLLHFHGYIWWIISPLLALSIRYAIERDPNIFHILRLLVDTYSVRSVLWSSPQSFPRKAKALTSAI